MFLLDEFFDQQAILFSLLEGLFVGIVGGGDEEVVDLVLAVGQAHLRLVLNDVLDLEKKIQMLESPRSFLIVVAMSRDKRCHRELKCSK